MHNQTEQIFTVGLFGVGLDAYWQQFQGLEDRLKGYLATVSQRLAKPYLRVINLGLVDTSEKAYTAGHQFRQAEVDLIFLYVTTYALSSTVLPVVRRAKVPVIVLNLAPSAAIDYKAFNAMGDRTKMTGEWLAYCQACSVPEIANVLKRSRIPFFQVTGLLENDLTAWQEISEWLEAGRVVKQMEHNRLGVMGHYYSGMLDVYSDLTLHCATFGGHIDIIEVDELTDLRRKVSSEEIASRVQVFQEHFEIHQDCSQEELERAARTSVALDRVIEIHKLGSLAYYYKGTVNADNEDTVSSIILGASLLTARGIPAAGECEINNAHAMKIMDCFGAGGSFTEFYAVDFNDDVVLMGHDGPGHVAIAQGKTKVRPLDVFHGKVGRGLAVEMSVRHGPVTLLSVVQTPDGRLKLLVAEALSEPGPILEIGNTNSRYRFSIGVRALIDAWNAEGPGHHCAVGLGHISNKVRKFSQLLGVECTVIG
jgi:L-arabinose isomerase